MTTKSMIFTGGIETSHAAFEQALIDLPVDLSALEHVDLARIQLEGVRPLCFVVDPTTEIGRRVCADARLSNLLADVPVVAVVDDPWGPETTNALVLGVDDYLPRFEAIHLRTKVRALLRVGPSIAPESAPSVVIADPDRERRVH